MANIPPHMITGNGPSPTAQDRMAAAKARKLTTEQKRAVEEFCAERLREHMPSRAAYAVAKRPPLSLEISYTAFKKHWDRVERLVPVDHAPAAPRDGDVVVQSPVGHFTSKREGDKYRIVFEALVDRTTQISLLGQAFSILVPEDSE